MRVIRDIALMLLALAAPLTYTRAEPNPVSACFLNTKEASGVSVIAFATGQQIAAEICDRTFSLWTPTLVEIAGHVMASSASNPIVAEFMANAEQYATRRHIALADLFREVGESLRDLRSQVLTREYCVEFSRALYHRRLSPDSLIGAAVLDAAVAKGVGKICGSSAQ